MAAVMHEELEFKVWLEEVKLRDEFARAAIIGLCTRNPYEWSAERKARMAYEIADAMLEARKATR